MKKLMLVALSMVMSSMVFAHGGDVSNPQSQDNNGFWQGMNEIHDMMHNTSISEKQSDNGLTFEITASSDSTVGSIKKRFIDDQVKLQTFLKDVDVTVHSLDNGVEVILESNDENTVKRMRT